MRAELDHNSTDRTFMLNPAAAVPPDPDVQRRRPVVAVLGQPARVAALPAHLPAGWSVRVAGHLGDVRADEIVLLSGATVDGTAAARAALAPRTRIVALLDGGAPAELVAGVLAAGADACVRGGAPGILASHLVACRRRQLAGRWHNERGALPRL
jgi:hypothetical protein